LWHFAALGALAGLPAVLGAWGGGIRLLARAGRLGLRRRRRGNRPVIWQIGRGMTRPDEPSRGFGAAGLVIGFLVMYVTGLIT
jgi:hypothetical protein